MLSVRTQSVTFRRSKRQGMTMSVTERYARDDIPCALDACTRCPMNARLVANGVALLSKNYGRIVVPDCSVVSRYIALLEQECALQNMVFCQTAIDALDRRNRTRTIRNVRRVAADMARTSVVFSNEIFTETRLGDMHGMPWVDRDIKAIYQAAEWYQRHLNMHDISVIILTLKDHTHYPNTNSGIAVWYFADYLAAYHPQLLEHYRSVEQATLDGDMDITTKSPAQYAQARLQAKAQNQYTAYYSPADIEEGLRNGTLVRGKIRILPASNLRSESQGIIERSDGADIVVSGRAALNRACTGDLVVVKLLAAGTSSEDVARDAVDSDDEDEEELAVEQVDVGDETPVGVIELSVNGVVVGITERKWRPFVATLQIDEAGGMRHLAVPVDASVPKIRFHYPDPSAIADRYFVVAIDEWPADSQYPQGHFIRALGKIGALDAEIDTILIERQIAVSQSALGFSEASLREMPEDSAANPWAPSASDISDRRDLRDTLVFSIDPKGSQDIDDAISMRRTREGFELGVHIADVTQFVHPGSATDKEACARGTTVYLADRRFNMIPEILSERICSLRSNCDRLAVSVIWNLDSNYKVTRTWYGRTVIRSACEMFYEQAQALLDGQRNIQGLDRKLEGQLAESIIELTKAMRVLREHRRQAGALELASTEVKFAFDPQTHAITEAAPKASLEIHRVIEEAMVFANAAVARRIHRSFPKAALLRRHKSPTLERFERLRRAAQSRGFSVDCATNASLAQSLQKITNAASDPDLVFLAKSMATLAMQEADYFATGDCAGTSEFAHYGLALEFYTHFTSPIRRYADIIVHRQLLDALADSKDSCLAESRAWVSTTAARLNERNRQSKIAQRESTELFQSRYVSQLTASGQHVIADGVVAEVRTNGLIVYVPRFGIRGPVHLRDKSGHIRLPLSTLSGKVRDVDTYIDSCSDFQADAEQLAIRLPINVPGFHLGSPKLRFAVFDHVKVLLRVLETRRRRPPVYLTLVSRASTNAKAYHSTLPPLDNLFKMSAAMYKSKSTKAQSDNKADVDTAANQEPRPAAVVAAATSTKKKKVDLYAVLEKFRELSLLEK
ncbi:hypothetical protein IWW36_003615 [Coemansia brasiliensis]|uniref:DIS3-like exonuclease 1 n=1 Tax=Coemansia brasiliensis TaxID=2650707 RepID=A0A9W8IDQ3_9FUNG|nr:hypothetical protein IWW36_003615 [Coemansia brasiliensis]